MLSAGAAKVDLPTPGAPTTLLPLPPRARALVLSDGETRVAIVSADLLLIINGSSTGRCVDQIRASVAKQTGIANVLIVATHDHSSLSPLNGSGDPATVGQFVNAITQAIVLANAGLAPAEVAVARGEAREGFNRVRRVEADGAVNYVSKLNLAGGAIESYDIPLGTADQDSPPRVPGTEKAEAGVNFTAQPAPPAPSYCTEPNPAWAIDSSAAQAAYRARHPLDPMDDEVMIVAIRRSDSHEPIATLINYALHGVVITTGTDRFAHGDWSGAMMSWVEGTGPFDQPVEDYDYVGGVALFLQGAAGDVNPWFTGIANIDDGHCNRRGIQAAVDVGSRIGTTVVQAVRGISDADYGSPDHITMKSAVAPVLGGGTGACALFFGVPTVAELNAVVVVGPAASSTFALGTFPGELFTEYGLALTARSPVPNTMLVGYTNDYIGYLPGEDSWGSGAYATIPANYACLAQETGTDLLRKVLDMLAPS